jgi:hypothetical protein
MTKVAIRKIVKKAAARPSSARAQRFKDLAIEHGARNLGAKIDHAIQESDERRERVKKLGSVTVAVS